MADPHEYCGEPLMGKVSGGGEYPVNRARARLSAIGEAMALLFRDSRNISIARHDDSGHKQLTHTITKYLDAQYHNRVLFHPVDTHTRMD